LEVIERVLITKVIYIVFLGYYLNIALDTEWRALRFVYFNNVRINVSLKKVIVTYRREYCWADHLTLMVFFSLPKEAQYPLRAVWPKSPLLLINFRRMARVCNTV